MAFLKLLVLLSGLSDKTKTMSVLSAELALYVDDLGNYVLQSKVWLPCLIEIMYLNQYALKLFGILRNFIFW